MGKRFGLRTFGAPAVRLGFEVLKEWGRVRIRNQALKGGAKALEDRFSKYRYPPVFNVASRTREIS
jgi:hypothetical protein